jgi:hypothetical protein
MKQGKLYTVTKGNLFAFGDPIKRADVLASRLYGENYGDKGFTLQDYMNDKGNNWFGISKKNNPFSKMNIGNTASIGAGIVGDVAYNAISDGYEIGGVGGNFLSAAQAIKTGNPFIDLGKDVGLGLLNHAIGIKTNEAAKRKVDSDIATLSNTDSSASSFDDVGTANLTTNASGVYKGGWFSGGRARRKNAALQAELDNSLSLARNNINNNIQNIASDQMSNMMRNYAAYGGALGAAALPQYTEPGIGVAEYDFMKDYLTTKRMQAESKNKLSGVQSVAANNMFDMGGKKKKKDNRTILQKANDWFDETFPNRNKPVVEMIPEWLYTSPLKYLMNDDDQKTNYGGAVNSFNGQGAGGGWGTAPYVPKNTKSFSEAFDEARQAGAEDFIFGDKIYNTIKEANPIREFNNRIVGNSRTEKQIRARKGYGKDFGPIQTKEAVLPIIPYAEGGTLFALGGDYQTNGAGYSIGQVYDVSVEEANRLKALGYEFTVVR